VTEHLRTITDLNLCWPALPFETTYDFPHTCSFRALSSYGRGALDNDLRLLLRRSPRTGIQQEINLPPAARLQHYARQGKPVIQVVNQTASLRHQGPTSP
jgi:hypothetical protein